MRGTSTSMMFNKYSVNPELLANMFNDAQQKGVSYPYAKYYWIDPLTNNAIEKKSLYTNWKSSDGVDGVIGIGYTVRDISRTQIRLYDQNISTPTMISVQLLIGVLACIMYFTGDESSTYRFIKSSCFLVSMFIFLIIFANTQESVNSYDVEIHKKEGILSSLMSVAFMSSVTIYINTKLKGVDKGLYLENSCIFASAILMLLISSYSSTNYKTLAQLVKERVSKQFLFNFAILLNVYIIVNFVLYLLEHN